jgi:hypothetical protein
VLNVKKNPIKITENMVILGEGLNYFSLIVIINSFPQIFIQELVQENKYFVLRIKWGRKIKNKGDAFITI